ncbi:MAG: hypothetical protein WD872_04560 [Pirellulaceae bacterium]
MDARLWTGAVFAAAVLASATVLAQSPATAPRRTAAPASPGEAPAAAKPAPLKPPRSTIATVPIRDLTPVAPAEARSGLRITKGSGVLPNDHGQLWREYDISTYTSRVTDSERPEQAVVDWVLRETGTDVWFSEPLGILSANISTLRVYHTPEMQQTVRDVVERLVNTDGHEQVLGLRLVTVGSPNWRARAVALLRPIDVKSPGVEGWVLSRENAAMLYESLKSRADFREHSAPRVEIFNGQSQTLTRTQPRRYQRGVQLRSDGLGYELLPGSIDEGYSLQVSPLLSLDGQTVDAAIKCQVDQVERLVPIALDVPVVGQGGRVQIQVPQVVSWRLNERLRWDADQVLVLSCGVVANPAADAGGPLSRVNPFGASKSRADALLFVEHRGSASELPAAGPATTPPATNVPAAETATGPKSPIGRGRY